MVATSLFYVHDDYRTRMSAYSRMRNTLTTSVLILQMKLLCHSQVVMSKASHWLLFLPLWLGYFCIVTEGNPPTNY